MDNTDMQGMGDIVPTESIDLISYAALTQRVAAAFVGAKNGVAGDCTGG